jgi:hypothetical protein
MIRRVILLVLVLASLFTLLTVNTILAYATATTTEQPRPGTLIVITFENGTTKAIRSDSTDIQVVNGGYFISDSSVKASQPLQSKTVSNTVVQQLVGVFVDVRIDNPPTTSKGCAEGWGYYVDNPSPICEPLDKIGEGPPPDMAFCAALGCPYNPPNLPDPSPEPEPPSPEPCPAGTTGTPPNCEPIPGDECPPGTTGTPPNCEPIQPDEEEQPPDEEEQPPDEEEESEEDTDTTGEDEGGDTSDGGEDESPTE